MKRALDIVVSLPALILLLPVLVVVAIAVALSLGRPVFFHQPRAGLGGRVFGLVKFRTMSEARDAQGVLLPDHLRVNRLGHLLRATSLDELPSLWCVLRGDLSLVGPRPLLVDYLPLYSAEQSRRHLVRPGITGWAQVNGRNAVEWPERLALDVWYVDHQSFWLDLRILWRTVLTVVARDGIQYHGDVAMPRFTGTPATTPTSSSRMGRDGSSDSRPSC